MARLSSLVVVLALTCAAGPVFAQSGRPERPYRGLFGSGMDDATHALTASASLGGGWDDNILADARKSGSGAPGDPRTARKGGVGTGSAALGYLLNAGHVTLNADAGASARYYPNLPQDVLKVYNGSFRAAVGLPWDMGVTATQSIVYQPFTVGVLTPVDPGDAITGQPPTIELVDSAREYMLTRSALELSKGLGRHTSLGAQYTYRHAGDSLRGDFEMQGVGGTLSHGIARGITARAGYQYGEGRYPGGLRRVRSHNINAGIDVSRQLSFSRRTTVSFGTGSSAVESNGRTHIRATGEASLAHEMGRTWLATLGYHREVRALEFFQDTVFSDSVTAGVGGLLSRRLQLHASGRAVLGSVGLNRQGKQFDTYSGSAGLSYALVRQVSLSLSYSYFQYRFDDAVALPGGIARHIERQSVRASINVWTPIFNRTRRPDAAR
jgi:opacity protein-like surface antigen